MYYKNHYITNVTWLRQFTWLSMIRMLCLSAWPVHGDSSWNFSNTAQLALHVWLALTASSTVLFHACTATSDQSGSYLHGNVLFENWEQWMMVLVQNLQFYSQHHYPVVWQFTANCLLVKKMESVEFQYWHIFRLLVNAKLQLMDASLWQGYRAVVCYSQITNALTEFDFGLFHSNEVLIHPKVFIHFIL